MKILTLRGAHERQRVMCGLYLIPPVKKRVYADLLVKMSDEQGVQTWMFPFSDRKVVMEINSASSRNCHVANTDSPPIRSRIQQLS